MSAIDRLYKKSNKTIQRCISLDNELYEELKNVVENYYDATISDLVNVCIEDYINENDIKYYAKPFGEISISRSIMIRKDNLEELKRLNETTGISITRLINGAIKDFLEKFNKK